MEAQSCISYTWLGTIQTVFAFCQSHQQYQVELFNYINNVVYIAEVQGLTPVCEALLSESVCLDCRFHMEGLKVIDHVYSKCQPVSISK